MNNGGAVMDAHEDRPRCHYIGHYFIVRNNKWTCDYCGLILRPLTVPRNVYAVER